MRVRQRVNSRYIKLYIYIIFSVAGGCVGGGFRSSVSGIVFVRVVEPLCRGHCATAEHPPPASRSGVRARGSGARSVELRLGGIRLLLLVLILLKLLLLVTWTASRPERRPRRVVRAAQVVSVLVRPDPESPVVLGELGRGPGQRWLAERPDKTAAVVVSVIRRTAPAVLVLVLVLLVVVVVRRAHVTVVVRHFRSPEVHHHLAHRPANAKIKTHQKLLDFLILLYDLETQTHANISLSLFLISVTRRFTQNVTFEKWTCAL